MIDQDSILSTAQVAEILAVSESTIRTWKKKHNLIKTEHWLMQDRNLYWTQSGLEILRQIQNAQIPSETKPTTTSIFNHYEPLIEAIVDYVIQSINHRIKQKLSQPMSHEECTTLLESVGIQPNNPIALLTGSEDD